MNGSTAAVADSMLFLPPIVFGPISQSIGRMQVVLAAPRTEAVLSVSPIRLSPRVTEQVHLLSSGEKIIVTSRRRITRPVGVDGVLTIEGTQTRWDSHKLLDEFRAEVDSVGWKAVATKIAGSWRNRVAFRAEQSEGDGHPTPGEEGLRPPQLGALHAIGAHWALHRQPATVVMPTGTGKTETILAAIAAYCTRPVLIAVPSDVLRSQTAIKCLTFGLLRRLGVLDPSALNPIVGVVTRRPTKLEDLTIFENCNVLIGTVSSLAGGDAAPLSGDIASRVETLVVDEAHHVGAAGWSEFRDAFKDRRILQLTATPFRRDGKLVDGQVIFNYPLRLAQRDGYFKRISFETVYELSQSKADEAIAAKAIAKLRADLSVGRTHVLMARCSDISRADLVHKIYLRLAADLNPMLVHSELAGTDQRIEDLRSGRSRIAVCVNMLGEGFDLPELKVAAIHDLHKSLAILLQFTGRFTRSAGPSIGDATVVANIADANVSLALERLYSEDADWNELLSELSSEAAKDHAELVAFLNGAQRLDPESEGGTVPIAQHILRPTLSTLFFAAEEFRPKRFYEGLPAQMEVHRTWLHAASNTLFFVTRLQPVVPWTRSKALRDLEWGLFVLHFDPKNKLLYLSTSDHSSTFDALAKAVGATTLISGDQIFRTLGRINRLVFQNIGVKKHGRRNLRYAMYTGADVAEALSVAERAGSVKSNLSGTGWENGKPITIGCSYKGRVWSREQAAVPRLVKWCEEIGAKLVDKSIQTKDVIANVLIPEEVEALPDAEVLSIEWPIELLAKAEERVTFTSGTNELSMSLVDLRIAQIDRSANTILFDFVDGRATEAPRFALTVGGDEGFKVAQVAGTPISITVGSISGALADYLSNYPPLVRFVDLTELDGNLLVRPQHPQDLSIPEERFEAWEWENVDLTKESIWKGGDVRIDSIQWHVAQKYIEHGFDVVFDDDEHGEAADLVCLKEENDHIKVVLVHCKFAGGHYAGARIKDVVEVASQAVRSAKWKWRFKDLCRHLLTREEKLKNGRDTRFLAGTPTDINRISRANRFKEVRAEILLAQPGLSKTAKTSDQTMVLAAAEGYLSQTIGIPLVILCSA